MSDAPESIVRQPTAIEVVRKAKGNRQLSGNAPGQRIYNDEQLDQIKTWLVAGYGTAEVIDRIERRGWPIANRTYYSDVRRMLGVNLKELKQQRLQAALSKGYALRAERVAALHDLADRLRDIMATHLIVERARWIGTGASGEKVIDDVINTDLSREFRTTLRQLAEEVGDVPPDFILNSVLNALPAEVRAAVIELAKGEREPDAAADASEPKPS